MHRLGGLGDRHGLPASDVEQSPGSSGIGVGLAAVERSGRPHRVEHLVDGSPALTRSLLEEALRVEVASVEDAVEAAKVGFAKIAWDLIKDGGEAILARDAITVRCLQTSDGELPASEDAPDLVAYVARSY